MGLNSFPIPGILTLENQFFVHAFQEKMIMRSKFLGLCLALFAGTVMARGDVLEQVVESYPLDEGGSISLENVNGSVTVDAWEGNEVRLEYRIIGNSEKALDRVEVRINSDSAELRVETHYSKNKSWFGDNDGASVEYELQVPATANLSKIETVNGSISITGVRGTVDAETVNGEIKAHGLRQDTKLDTVNGGIEAWFDQFGDDQRVRMESVNGRLKVYLPDNADVEIKAETVHGSLKNDFGLEVEKGFVGRDLRGKLGNGGGRLILDTVNGSISIRRD
jgi:DUF4097 and DUF4098 domain-containing protein YvlB